MSLAEEDFNEITAFFTNQPNVKRSQMFGMPCLKVKGKVFLCLYEDEMVFKLSGQSHSQALALEGSSLFDPSRSGRPMKEWVRVPAAYSSTWIKLAEAAYLYINSQNEE